MAYVRKTVVKERVIEKYFRDQMLRTFPGCQVHKYTPRKSEPDRICLLSDGRALFVELKRPGEEPRPDQYRALERLKSLGFTATWIDTREGVDEFIKELLL